MPDERFHPICHACGSKAQRIYRHDKRSLRDLNPGSVRVWINCSYRKIACESCNRIVVEDLGFFQPYSRVTHRLAAYIHELCKVLTVTEVAKHFGIINRLIIEHTLSCPFSASILEKGVP
ncbi:MAG: hypothetical protein L3J18_00575 [Candidatus Brocadia sp.]|nr:MAG: hypothetical protein L3J18_00575 [Candidatus Brocadia sp.]